MTELPPRPDLVRITDLHATQMTMGFSEIVYKPPRWHTTFEKMCRKRPVAPVVRGPQGVQYLLVRHHLVRAASEEGVVEVLVEPTADLRRSPAARGLQRWKPEAELSWNEHASLALQYACC